MRHTLCLILFCSLSLTLSAQTFSAIYQPSDKKVRQVERAGWEAFLAEHQQQNAAGYRLTDLETYRDGGEERRYIGIYTESPLPDSLGRASSWAEFIKLKRKMAKAEYTMIDVAAVVHNESDYDFYGIWVKEANPTIHKVWLLDSRETILKRTRAMAKDRFKIKRVHVLDVPNGEPSFVVLYHFSPINRYNFLYFANTAEEFAQEMKERKGSKVELIDYDEFREGDKVQYVAIFQDGDYDSDFVSRQSLEAIREKEKSLDASRGLRIVNLSVD
ncbi:hypothetical protein [Lewinella sp. W8]|uniref:hypothetical protein n=1 Tax=Lewinella sp. W8 TaxID=2528208 RepID=UPI001068D126|nr:hypothetical protein [Lewinella sp. W8]MTB51251.1 hypothetical protein [Lewinella sp. W8]